MQSRNQRRHAVLLVAHADDETLGCGGYVPLLVERGYRVTVVIGSCATFARAGATVDNRAAAHAAVRRLGADALHFLELEDQRFERYGTREICDRLDELTLEPDLILTHAAGDLNRDHRVMHEIALLVGRPIRRRPSLLGCEVPNGCEYAGGSFRADFYVDVARTLAVKQAAFADYTNEARPYPHPYSVEAIEVKARQRGLEVGLPLAEAYQVIRWFDA